MGPHQIAACLLILGHHHGLEDAHREVVEGAPGARRALLQLGADHVPVVLGTEEDGQPAIRLLGGQRHPAGRQRGQVDGNAVADGVRDDVQPHRHLKDLAVVLQSLALEHGADDLHRLPEPSHPLLELDTVPALDHLVAGGAQAEVEAAVGVALEVPGRVRERHRAAGERDRDAGAELDPLGVLGRDEQRVEGVVAGLGRPDAVIAGSLGFPGRLGRARQVETDPAIHFHL